MGDSRGDILSERKDRRKKETGRRRTVRWEMRIKSSERRNVMERESFPEKAKYEIKKIESSSIKSKDPKSLQ
jgi:hypothetical protein